MSYFTSIAKDVLASGETHTEMMPRGYRAASAYGVVHAHGYGSDHTTPFFPTSGGKPLLALANAGFPVITAQYGPGKTAGQENWGNDPAIAIVDAAVARAEALSGKPGVILAGTSMGFLTVCNWARLHPSKVKGIVGMIPACDLDLCLTLSGGSYASSLKAAYGGDVGYAAAKPTHDPQSYKAELIAAAFPIRIAYSTDDPVQSPPNQLAWAQAVGATIQTQAGGHILDNLNTASLLTWARSL